jgi:hypothetical protein
VELFAARPLRYLLHGLAVSSNQPIPGLRPSSTNGHPDLRVWLGAPFPPPIHSIVQGESSTGDTWFEAAQVTASGEPSLKATRLAGGHYRIRYADGLDFVINGSASELWAAWPSNRSISDVPAYLLGPIIGVILRLRGTICLHASAIDLDGRAVAFVGSAGAGKSTTVAAFAARGVPVLSDDMLALSAVGESWVVAAGYPRVRLWPESAHAIAGNLGPRSLVPPGESGSTTRYHLDLLADGHRFEHRSRPLGLVYVLEEADTTSRMEAVRLTQSAALIALVANTYGGRILDRTQRAAEFDTLSRLVARVPVRRLTRPADFARLPAFLELVGNDLAALDLAGSSVGA